MTKQEIRKHIVMLNSDLNDQAYLRTNGTISQAEYDQVKARIQKRIRELKQELSMMTETNNPKELSKDKHNRCSIHKMYHNPCIICQEIDKLKEDVLDRNAKTIELEIELNAERFHSKKYHQEACNFLNQMTELTEQLENEQQEVSDLKVTRKELEQEVSTWQSIVEDLQKVETKQANTISELEFEIEELSADLEKALNNANKSYNPEAKLKLSVNDLLVVRGIFVANSFLFNSLHNIDQCIMKKKDKTTQEQLMLIKKDLEKEWQRVVDLLKVFAKEFSDSNWNRMIRETQKIVEVSVETMNRRDLGHFTVGKEEELDIEYQIKPLVIKAVNDCINSSGTNNLTAYSKEQLVKSITKIVEEK